MTERGKYIVIEGNDGTGKSTQVGLLRQHLTTRGVESIEFHEPEGTPMADVLRTAIKNGELERDAETNLLLFTAARHEIWHKRALPTLKLGGWVVAARNYYSTIAYQGYGEGLDRDLIIRTTRQFTDDHYMNPDLAIILTMEDSESRSARIGNRGELDHPDTFESRGDDFQSRLDSGYRAIAREFGLPTIDADRDIASVAADIQALADELSENLA